MTDATVEAKPSGLKGAEKKEAFHREAESRRQPFKFTRPDYELIEQKGVHYLCSSDIMMATVQIIPEGGDNNLHYHPGADGFWMVLKGKVRFYGPDGAVGEYGPNEGIVTPRNARYWFESADTSQELHLLHVSAHTQQKVGKSRVNVDSDVRNYSRNVKINYPEGHTGGD